MIPLDKLAKLPRSQRLRKAAKIFGEAEQRFIQSEKLLTGEIEYLCVIMELLSKDESFAGASASALRKAAHVNYKAENSEKDGEEIRRTLNTVNHILLAETGRYMADWDFIKSAGMLDVSKRRVFPGMQAYLEDIRSPFNVGSMFRAAESFGAEKLWLSPLCADPRHKRAERTAMGCVDILSWERLAFDPFSGLEEAGAEKGEETASTFSDGPFFAMETGGIPLGSFPFPAKGILIAGSEELGVSPQALAMADASLGRVSISVYGAKASLNVSVAFGIVMQAWAESQAKHNLPGKFTSGP